VCGQGVRDRGVGPAGVRAAPLQGQDRTGGRGTPWHSSVPAQYVV
jgi:hypothetical protein